MLQCVIAHFQHDEELHDDTCSIFLQVAWRVATLLQVTVQRFSCMIHINQLVGAFQVQKKHLLHEPLCWPIPKKFSNFGDSPI